MAEIEIDCPHCGQHIQCEEGYRGMGINCPTCETLFRIPTLQNHADAEKPLPQQAWRNSAATQPVAASSLVGKNEREIAMPQQCPQCSSSDIQRASMGYMTGTSQVSGTAVGATIEGEIGVGAYQGSQQSLLASFLSPPAKRWVVLRVIVTYWIATCFFLLYYLVRANPDTDPNDSILAVVAFAPILAPCLLIQEHHNIVEYLGTDIGALRRSERIDVVVFMIFVVFPTIAAISIAKRNHAWNKEEYTKLMQKYEKRWYCKKCGYAWLPGDPGVSPHY